MRGGRGMWSIRTVDGVSMSGSDSDENRERIVIEHLLLLSR